jgi:FG-GAP repeat
MEKTVRSWSVPGSFLLAFGLLCVSSLTGHAQSASHYDNASLPLFIQQARLTASDAARLDFLGASVAISGNTVAVGMANTSTPGAVYVFVKPSNGWSNMTQVAKLTASDGTPNDYLGYSVSIAGDTIVAGAPNSHGYRGAAYVFVKPSSGWTNATETAELSASSTYGALGSSVAIGGNTVVVGSPNPDTSRPGAAYVYVKPANGWTNMTQTATLTRSQGHANDGLGSCVAISGNTAVAGNQKKVYVFVEPTNGWADMTQNAELFVPNGAAGFSVAINGGTIVSGYPYATIGSNYAQGAAYVFVQSAKGWTNMTPTATLTASDGVENDWLGYSVAMSGNLIVTGVPFAAIGSNPTQGAAYTFMKPATGWKSTSHFNAKIVETNGAQNDDLGWSASLSGNALLIGAPGASSQQGAAYIFGQ